ncbi:trichohyalin-like isoform X2 [Clytia hemisphaerica]|uniref:trichohyalin-like isoform X2 n=1 Tax=Clytia hemisphaerica TaxID=252671 RepID=UPI0034D76481
MDEEDGSHHQEPERPLVYEPPDLEGRQHVAKVTNDFRIREDECLADKLQNEEFEYHFGQNRSERWRGQLDIKKAKQIYLQEVEKAGLLSKDEMNKLCVQDAALATEIDSQINEKKDLDAQRKTAIEMQDEEFARYLEERERKKYEHERRKRLQQRLAEDKVSEGKIAAAARAKQDIRDESGLESGASEMRIRSSSQDKWDVQCESSGRARKTPSKDQERNGRRDEEREQRAKEREMQELKDKEIAKRLQLQEVQSGGNHRSVEERDRMIAMRLQQKEAQEYKREREMRRTQSERRPEDYDPRHNPNDQYDDRKHEESTPSRSMSEKPQRSKHEHSEQRQRPSEHQRQRPPEERERASDNQQRRQRPPEERQRSLEDRKQRPLEEKHRSSEQRHKTSQQRIEDEPIYLKAVDSPEHKNSEPRTTDARRRADQPIDRERALRQQEELYKQAQQKSKEEKRRHGSSSDERRLVDDQLLMRQQARDLSRVGGQQASEHRSTPSKNKSNQRTHHTPRSDAYADDYVNTRPSGHAPRRNESMYDEPEQNNSIDYTNIARNIDPTYQGKTPEPDYETIGRPGLYKGQVGVLEPENPLSKLPPAHAIPNVKRSSKKDDKKKNKKWF